MSYLLFDIGGTTLRLAISADGKTLAHIEHAPTPADPKEAVAIIEAYAHNHLAEAAPVSITGGLPGVMDTAKSMPITLPNLPQWNNFPLQQTISEKIQAPTHLENDAALCGLGEAVFGSGQGKHIVAYLTVSTGLGGTRIVNGHIDASSGSFEPGHHIIHADGLECGCGAKGHLEAYASGSGLYKQFRQPAHQIKDPAIWQQVAHELAIGLNNTICFWSPDIIVLGGSLMKSLSVEAITQELKNLKPVFPTLPEITQASLGEDSGLYGALASAT